MSESILQTDETKKNNIIIDNLKANTSYEMKIFIKTHIGYNPDHYLLINFKTKFGSEFNFKLSTSHTILCVLLQNV